MIILVTGGNRGIGKEITRQLASTGHTVILGSRDIQLGVAAAAEMAGNIHPHSLDMGSQDSIQAMAGFIETTFGQLDVLINNAGTMSQTASTQASQDEMKRAMDVNFHGPHSLIQACLPLLRKGTTRRIINISSQMGRLSGMGGGYAGYRISKAALNALTILLANELRSEGFSVNAMCPGWVKTDMGGMGAPRSVAQGADTAVWLATTADTGTGKFFEDRRATGF